MDKKISDEMLREAADALRIQKIQNDMASDRLAELSGNLDKLNSLSSRNNSKLDQLLFEAEELMRVQALDVRKITVEDNTLGNSMIELTDSEKQSQSSPTYTEIDTIAVAESDNWTTYLDKIEKYAEKHSIDLTEDPFSHLLSSHEKSAIAKRIRDDYTMEKSSCDRLDYMIGAFSGVVSGLVDSFFVGMPGNSKLGNWTNKQTDQFVIRTAKMLKHNPRNNGKSEIANAISFFEERYTVNYDQATGKAAGSVFNMSMSNHHIKSLGHSPDIVGLLFSIVDQFSSTSHFLDNGRLISFDTKEQHLKGGNFIAKLYCGVVNWIGHLVSDMAGSSTSRRKNPNSSGSGIPMPLFELFQTVGKGNFRISSRSGDAVSEMSLADFSVRVFEEGYDARFGMAQAIPVLLNELMIRFLWAMKSRFVDQLTWKDCIPVGSHPNLRRVLLTGHGVLCLVDGIDAGLRSGGEILTFALHLNFTAWKRLAFSGILEVRALYKENALDLNAMEKDLEKEWNDIFNNSQAGY